MTDATRSDEGLGLNRHLAPTSARAWQRIDEEARDVLRQHLAARHLVEFEGPLGWEHSAIDLGEVEELERLAPKGARLLRRRVRPLLELRVPFELRRREVARIDRGARDADLEPLREAARLFAATEDTAIFEGYADADLPGLLTDSPHPGVALPTEGVRIPEAVTTALSQLRGAGVAGPYGLALGPDAYATLERTTGGGGYPVLQHVRRLIDGPVVWGPTLRGGVVLSLRGGDFRLVCGRDASIGYLGHDDDTLRLYLEESFGFDLPGPEAAVPLLAEGGP